MAALDSDETMWRDYTEMASAAIDSLLEWLRNTGEATLADEIEELVTEE